MLIKSPLDNFSRSQRQFGPLTPSKLTLFEVYFTVDIFLTNMHKNFTHFIGAPLCYFIFAETTWRVLSFEKFSTIANIF